MQYLTLLRDSLTADESLAIIRKAIEDAKGGSRHARQWLFSHVMPQFPKLSLYELSILEPEQKKNDESEIASPEFMLFCECCQSEDELDVFVKLYERVECVRSAKLQRLLPAKESSQ